MAGRQGEYECCGLYLFSGTWGSVEGSWRMLVSRRPLDRRPPQNPKKPLGRAYCRSSEAHLGAPILYGKSAMCEMASPGVSHWVRYTGWLSLNAHSCTNQCKDAYAPLRKKPHMSHLFISLSNAACTLISCHYEDTTTLTTPNKHSSL